MSFLRAVLSAVVVLGAAGLAFANGNEADFGEAVQALERGAYSNAVDRFELLADRGFVHPDASFDRAVAYLGRARSSQKQPGDLGRAAAALAETLKLRPGDREAASTLEAVRSELGRRQARVGGAPLFARPRLARALVGLAPERVWASIALLGSLVASIGIALRLIVRRPTTVVPGSLALGVGSLLLFSGGALTAGARDFRRTSKAAVVVASEARLLDETGRPLPTSKDGDGNAAPEGAEVYVIEHRGGLARVEWGSLDAWVVQGQVRELATP